jgi:hypothetical protein
VDLFEAQMLSEQRELDMLSRERELFLRALTLTDDVNEAYLWVHRVMARSMAGRVAPITLPLVAS